LALDGTAWDCAEAENGLGGCDTKGASGFEALGAFWFAIVSGLRGFGIELPAVVLTRKSRPGSPYLV
jgi:hypothetical protein